MSSLEESEYTRKKKKTTNNNTTSMINEKLKKELENTIHNLAETTLKDVVQNNSNKKNLKNTDNNNLTDNGRNQRRNSLPDRVFVARNSLLTDLFDNPHIKTIYNVCLVVLIIHIINTLVYDHYAIGRINTGTRIIKITFAKFDIVILLWTIMQILALLPHFFLKLWMKSRNALEQNRTVKKIYDITWLFLFISYQIGFLIYGTSTIFIYDLPIASTFVINLENIRFIMKVHAYVRSVSPRILEKSDAILPKFTHYIYFMFAPTMVYRDSYPKNDRTDWKKVMGFLLEMIGCLIFQSHLFERYFFTVNWKSLVSNSEPLEMKFLIQMFFQCVVPSLLFFMCGFYLLLHCWFNACAEMLRFADRRFYSDWWTQTNYGAFYRTWNIVVHDWLYVYIYKEIIKISRKRWMATLSVFIVSAIVHEFILIVAFRFFYPVLLIFFGIFSVICVYITKNLKSNIGNLGMIFNLFVGNGALWLSYGAEYFARENCPKIIENDFYDFIVPRSWYCQNIV